jgi:MoaA/NifB/PqqE/SkfB family radical SAM enzyme
MWSNEDKAMVVAGLIDRITKPVPKAPVQIQLEVTTRCNLTCVMCPHGLENGLPNKRDADADVVARALDDLDGVEKLHPTGLGEPLLAPAFWEIIDGLKGKSKPEITFHTNGQLMTEKNVERILAAPVGHIVVSVDAATSETHYRIRGANLQKTAQAVKRLAKARKNRRQSLYLQMAMVLMVENFREASAFVELGHELGADVVSFNHLMNTNTPPGTWKVKRDDFLFDYDSQRIVKGHPLAEASDAAVVEALDRADKLGIQVSGLNLFVNEDLRKHSHRPCRKYSGTPA